GPARPLPSSLLFGKGSGRGRVMLCFSQRIPVTTERRHPMKTVLNVNVWWGDTPGPDAPILGMSGVIYRGGEMVAMQSIYVQSPENKAWAAHYIEAIGERRIDLIDAPLAHLTVAAKIAGGLLNGPTDMRDWSVASLAEAED